MGLGGLGEEVVESAAVCVKGLGCLVGGTKWNAMGYCNGGGGVVDVHREDVLEGLASGIKSFVVSARDC